MLKLNPLSVCKKRKVNFLPVHFSKIQVAEQDFLFDNTMEEWIESKLHGRYAIVNLPHSSDGNKTTTKKFVAFEDSKELTFFMLAYPNIRRT